MTHIDRRLLEKILIAVSTVIIFLGVGFLLWCAGNETCGPEHSVANMYFIPAGVWTGFSSGIGDPDTITPQVPDPYTMNESVRAQSTGGILSGERSAAVAVAGYPEIPADHQQPVYPSNYTGQCILNESMISVSNGLAGSEISVGTYLETVCPEYLAGMNGSSKASLYNQSLQVSKIPDRDETAAFFPPKNVASTTIEVDPSSTRINAIIFGIFGIAILGIGYGMVRKYRK
jgi:hypothetical protein